MKNALAVFGAIATSFQPIKFAMWSQLIRVIIRFWETAHLPLPEANILP